MTKMVSVGALICLAFAQLSATETFVTNATLVCSRYEPGTVFNYQCWAAAGLKDGESAVYVFLERRMDSSVPTLRKLMASGLIPPGIAIFSYPGRLEWSKEDVPKEMRCRGMRCEEYDQIGTEFPSALIEEMIPDAERRLGVKVSASPDLRFITGASSGGIAAFNACWYRNDYFRRCYLSSPTFSNIRCGHTLMPLVRKCEARPIRIWMTVGTNEPDYYFGDSYLVAEDAASALRFAGYELRYDRFPHGRHGICYTDNAYLEKVLTWLFEGWRTTPVVSVTDPIRVRDVVVRGSEWEPCDFRMPPPVREVISTEGWLIYSVDPTNRFVMSEQRSDDGTRRGRIRHSPLELAWNVSQPGGKALAHADDDRLFVATELGVQGVVAFGLTDVVLPLPGDLPCDNVALIDKTLYASSGHRVFRRQVSRAAADSSKRVPPSTPGYYDGNMHCREHEPADTMASMLDGYIVGGRIAGVVSALSDNAYRESWNCAGWALYGDGGHRRVAMTPDTVFAIFSMTKTFTGAAIMCAIDDGKMSLDDEVAKYLPEFADVKMKDGSTPKRPPTIRDMMSHMSGFRGGASVTNRDIPLREVARRLAAQPLERQPGETFAYGNAPVCTAAACLEIAVGKPYENYLEERILSPLGMKDTTFWPNEDQLRRLARAYNSDDMRIRPAADACAEQLRFPKAKRIYPAASGGLFSTPRDMLRFSQMLAHHGEWKGARIISQKVFDGIFAVKQTPDGIRAPYTCGCWLYGDWFGHEGAMRTDQRANLQTGHSRVFFIQTENRAGSAFFQLKRDWHYEADKLQGTPPTVFGN